MQAIDILIDDDGFVISNGDFKIAESDGQHIKHIVQTHRGAWIGAPSLGVGMLRYLNGGEVGRLEQDVKIDLRADGYKFISFNIEVVNDTTDIDIKANRIK